MVTIDDLATAALNQDNLALRSLTQDLLRACPQLHQCPPPLNRDPQHLAAAAALIELLAMRRRQEPPSWIQNIAPLTRPIFLLKAALTMKHLRLLCETQSPEPLRKRGFYAPPNFLEFA
jgi:hypothetical protein